MANEQNQRQQERPLYRRRFAVNVGKTGSNNSEKTVKETEFLHITRAGKNLGTQYTSKPTNRDLGLMQKIEESKRFSYREKELML
jgi:hypothetical protein